MQSDLISGLTGSSARLSGTSNRPDTGPGPAEAPAPAAAAAVGCTGLTIRHVLVPLDGSALAECALPWAVAVAQVWGRAHDAPPCH